METNCRNRVMALVGLGALSAYVLACRPAFSPDGSQILFPALHVGASEVVVLRYNRKTAKTDSIFVLGSRVFGEERGLMSAAWLPDGQQAVVAWTTLDKKINVALLPLESRLPTRFLEVPLSDREEAMSSLLFPPLITGHYLFLGGRIVSRIDLERGEVETVSVGAVSEAERGEEFGVYLIAQRDEIYYLAGGEGRLEVGTINPDTLEVKRKVSLEGQDETLSPFAALSADGTRLAIASEVEGGSKISIIRGDKLEQTLYVGTAHDPIELGNVVWSRDEKSLYAAALKDPDVGDTRHRLFVLEISLTRGAIKAIPVGFLEDETDDAPMTGQVALSPDGKTIAISTAYALSEEMKDADRALYLVDVGGEEHKVTRVRLPWAH